MKLIICGEESGTIRDEFENRGHDAYSCDLLPTSSEQTRASGKHIQGDMFDALEDYWDMMIGHPVCRYITNSGAKHLYTEEGRWRKMALAVKSFNKLWRSKVKKKCLENPIPHKYAVKRMDTGYSQIIQPYMFGHLEQKATCLWLEGLPNLVGTLNVKALMDRLPDKEKQRIWYMSPGPERERLRSVTYKLIAKSMAEQWG